MQKTTHRQWNQGLCFLLKRNWLQRQGKSSRKGPDFCPRVMARFEELSVASGEETSIALQVKNLDSDIRDFRCRFHVGSAVHEKLARRDGDSLECEPTNLNSHGARLEQGRTRVPLDVMWTLAGNNQRHALDGSDDIHIEVLSSSLITLTLRCMTVMVWLSLAASVSRVSTTPSTSVDGAREKVVVRGRRAAGMAG